MYGFLIRFRVTINLLGNITNNPASSNNFDIYGTFTMSMFSNSKISTKTATEDDIIFLNLVYGRATCIKHFMLFEVVTMKHFAVSPGMCT